MQQPLVVHTDWSRSWGGQEIRVLTELREMQARGFRTGLIVRADAELVRRGQEADIPVHPIDFSSKFNFSAWRSLISLLRRLRPSVLNTHSSEDSWMAGCAGRLCRVPLIARTRHVLAPISSAFSYNAFPHVIFACSEAIRSQLLEQGVTAKKVVVQSTGIDASRFRYSEQDRREVRAQYGLGADDILVGNVAFLRHYKGHRYIVNTAARMPPRYKFMIVGGGKDQPLVESWIREAGVGDRFILTGHREDPERYFSAFDIIFFSSFATEGISQSYIQGLLYGIPMLVCRTPSLMEPLALVENYEVVTYDDLDDSSAALTRLATVSGRDEAQVARQRAAIDGKYGLQTMMEHILRVYKQYGIQVH